MHERGSQGARGSTAEVGAWKAPEPELRVLVVVDGVVVVVGAEPVPIPFPVVAVLTGAGAGGSTEKSVPVTTVIWEPGDTSPGSSAMITEPVKELATCWAAARSAGVLAA